MNDNPARPRKRVAVLISGRGSNLAALVAATRAADYPAEIVAVISDRADAAGLAFAREKGIAAESLPRSEYENRAAHEAALGAKLAEFAPDIVCLAGFMRLMSPQFVEQWRGRMINIHPSLLPAFKGLDTHARALEAGVRVHGCSVHFVTAGMDEGPIIAQAVIPVLPGDNEARLAARVLKAEHRLYPMALRMLAEGRVHISDGRAIISSDGDAAGMLISA